MSFLSRLQTVKHFMDGKIVVGDRNVLVVKAAAVVLLID